MTNTVRLPLAISVLLGTATASRADIGVIVLEPISALGFFTRVGHAGTYVSNICQDGSPIKNALVSHVRGLGLTAEQQRDLVEYLKSL